MEEVSSMVECTSLVSILANSIINDMKGLSNALRGLSKPAADINNALINKILLANDRDVLAIVKEILNHLFHIVELKGIQAFILSALTKVISFIKIIEETKGKQQKMEKMRVESADMNNIMYCIIDIIFLLKNKYKESEMMLRIIQTTFSLIDQQLLHYVDENIITRLYSICFECCLTTKIIQNISISALFALTEIVFATGSAQESCSILLQFLRYVLKDCKFNWIKESELKGLIWDLIIVGVKNLPSASCEVLASNKETLELIHLMYKTCLEVSFSEANLQKDAFQNSKNLKKSEVGKSFQLKKGSVHDFIRSYKAFVFFSIHLSLKLPEHIEQIVPFRQNLEVFKLIQYLERNIKMYILIEGINLLLLNGWFLLIEEERGYILLDVISKICQELCLANFPLDVNWEGGDLFLQKMCGEITKVTESDFVRLIKNTIIALRKRFEIKSSSRMKSEEVSERSGLSEPNDPNSKVSTEKKRWQKLIRIVIRVIRYLTSLNFKNSNEQTIRKLITEFQYWFLVDIFNLGFQLCPSIRTRNLILQELLNTSTLIETKMQAMKVSQCLQIGSNLIYGYYDSLDSIGLTILIKMMAGVKADWEEGKGFQELDEVFNMSEKLYTEQKLVTTQPIFAKTIQAFVQCANALVADMEQPIKPSDRNFRKTGRNPTDRYFKMIDYLLAKLAIIIEQNIEYLSNQWNFLTGFWISFCSNRNPEIKLKTITHVGLVISNILKKSYMKQVQVLSTYVELSKLSIREIEKHIVNQLKLIVPIITQEDAILEIFRVIKCIVEGKQPQKAPLAELSQLQEILVRDTIFNVKNWKSLIQIITFLNVLSKSKSEEYKLVNLIWCISDHLKMLEEKHELGEERDKVWKHLFGKLYELAKHSQQNQTKQSCIHTFTQILAESSAIIHKELFLEIMHEIYLNLFNILLGVNIHSEKYTEIHKAETLTLIVEMMKIGIKNYFKMIKKCIAENINQISEIVNQTLKNLLQHLKQLGLEMNMEYYYELLIFVEQINGLPGQNQLKNEFFQEKLLEELFLEIERHHSRFDKASLMWRKKYEPLYLQIRSKMIKDEPKINQ